MHMKYLRVLDIAETAYPKIEAVYQPTPPPNLPKGGAERLVIFLDQWLHSSYTIHADPAGVAMAIYSRVAIWCEIFSSTYEATRYKSGWRVN